MAKSKDYKMVVEITKGTNVDCPMWRDMGGEHITCGLKCPTSKHYKIPQNCPAKQGILIKVKHVQNTNQNKNESRSKE